MKYEFTGEKKRVDGVLLRRIRATTNFGGVHKGDIGGWIGCQKNLSQWGHAWVADNAMVYGNALVEGDACVYGNAIIKNNAWIRSQSMVFGNAIVDDSAIVSNDAKVYGDAFIGGDARIVECAKVGGIVYISGGARICGDAVVEKREDAIWFRNIWSSGRDFTYTRSNDKWVVGCFYGSGDELIKKAYADSETKGKCYEAIVRATEAIYKEMDKYIKI